MTGRPISVQQAPKATPVNYSFEDPGELVIESITGHWDGSGAGGPFRPAIGIYTAAGVLLSRTFPDTELQAGDEADITFAPFSGLGGGGVGAVAWLGRLSSDPPFPTTAASDFNVPWLNFRTSDRSVFGTNTSGSTPTNAPGDTRLMLRKPGMYVVHGAAMWDASTYPREAKIFFSGLTKSLLALSGLIALPDTTGWGSGSPVSTQDIGIVSFPPADAPERVQLSVQQDSGAPKSVVEAYLAAAYIPTHPEATIYGT